MDVDLDLTTGEEGRLAPPQNTPSLRLIPSSHRNNEGVCPSGMEFLLGTSLIYVHQLAELLEVLTGFETKNKYEILDMTGRRLYLAAEQSGCCNRWCFGPKRPFTIFILTNTGEIALKLVRKYSCCFGFLMCFFPYSNCCQELHVLTADDVYLGKVSENPCDCCFPSFTVWNEINEKKLKIKGPCYFCMCCSVVFKVYDMDGNEIGEIHKKWGGVIKEAYTDADTFGVSCPMDLDPRLKALLLGAIFLIDFMYFEKGTSVMAATAGVLCFGFVSGLRAIAESA